MSGSLRIFQKGFNYSQDGPGNRLVYHLQGCNLRCPWCANPESIAWENAEAVDRPISEVLSEAVECRRLFFEGGGVTFTGGEPTLQWEGLCEALSGLQDRGIHTAIETNGMHSDLPHLFHRIDCLMLDIKHHDPLTHEKMCGRSHAQALENLGCAVRSHPRVIVRIPLVTGYNAAPEDIQAFIRLFAALSPGPQVSFELLRYHEYGRHKWEQMGMPYQVRAGEVSPEAWRAYEAQFRQAGLQIIRT